MFTSGAHGGLVLYFSVLLLGGGCKQVLPTAEIADLSGFGRDIEFKLGRGVVRVE